MDQKALVKKETVGARIASGTVYEIAKEAFNPDTCGSDVIAQALENYDHVIIPKLSFPVYLNRPIVMKSEKWLTVHPETAMRMLDGCGGCMVRNEHVVDGRFDPFPADYEDHDILVEGGIWEQAKYGYSPVDDHPAMRSFATRKYDGTVLAEGANARNVLLGVFLFSNVKNFTVRDLIVRKCEFYGVLVAGGSHFVLENIEFQNHHKDGLHINGPSSYGYIRNISGQTGDDVIALNAWDWATSAVSFGGIDHMDIDGVTCDHREVRLLPGRKAFLSGSKVDCPITNCRFQNIQGVYCFKMYQQPYWLNDFREFKDKSEIAGVMENVEFRNIALGALTEEGLGEIKIEAIFEICADCTNISLENIALDIPLQEVLDAGVQLVKIGPKSSTCKQGHTDPSKWCELFDTDLICTVDDLQLRNISFAGVLCREQAALVSTVRLTPNPDYPNTTPKGGTGYGILKAVTVE